MLTNARPANARRCVVGIRMPAASGWDVQTADLCGTAALQGERSSQTSAPPGEWTVPRSCGERRSGSGPRRSGSGPRRSGSGPRRSGSGPRRSGSGPRRSGSGPRTRAVHAGLRRAAPSCRRIVAAERSRRRYDSRSTSSWAVASRGPRSGHGERAVIVAMPRRGEQSTWIHSPRPAPPARARRSRSPSSRATAWAPRSSARPCGSSKPPACRSRGKRRRRAPRSSAAATVRASPRPRAIRSSAPASCSRAPSRRPSGSARRARTSPCASSSRPTPTSDPRASCPASRPATAARAWT